MAAVEERVGAVLVHIVQRSSFLRVLDDRAQFPPCKVAGPRGVMRLEQYACIGLLFPDHKQLVRKRARFPQLARLVFCEPESPDDGETL